MINVVKLRQMNPQHFVKKILFNNDNVFVVTFQCEIEKPLEQPQNYCDIEKIVQTNHNGTAPYKRFNLKAFLVDSVNRSKTKMQPELESYEKEGYTVFRNVIDQDLIKEVSDHVDWLQSKHPDLRPENLGHFLVAKDPFWIRLVSDPRLLKIAEQFVGPDVALFASHYISKPAHDGQPVLWHQDGSYWPLDPMKVVSLWLAVDDSNVTNGCLRVIPKSHHLGLQELKERNDVANVLSSSMDETCVEESLAVDVQLKKGDVSVHHPQLVHGSKPNNSNSRRCGLTIRYIPTSTKITGPIPGFSDEQKTPSAFFLCGKEVQGLNSYHPWPKYIEGECFPFNGCEEWK